MTSESVWAVTKGSYSDFHVNFVCLSKELAEEAVEKMGSDYSVREYGLLRELPQRIYYHTIQCVIDADPAGEPREGTHAFAHWVLPDEPVPNKLDITWAPGYERNGAGTLRVTGSDLQRVQQVYSDEKARLLDQPELRLNWRGWFE